MKNILRILAVLALCVGTAFAQNQSGSVNSGGTVASPVTKLVAGTGISLSPTSGIGSVTVTATGTSGEAITDDTTTNATMFPVWVTANTGTLPLKVTSTKMFFNPSTGALSSTHMLLNGLSTDGTGALQFPAATTSAGGITMGTDLSIYRIATGQLALAHIGGNTPVMYFYEGAGQVGYVGSSSGDVRLNSNIGITLRTNNGTTALTLDSSQGATFVAKAVSTSPSGGIGYATGAGGAVTQLTDKTTAVTLNTVTGAVTTAATALGAGTSVGFTVNDSSAATTDYVGCSIDSGATLNSYTVTVDSIGAGTFHIHLRNESAGSLSEAIVIRFVVIKAVSS